MLLLLMCLVLCRRLRLFVGVNEEWTSFPEICNMGVDCISLRPSSFVVVTGKVDGWRERGGRSSVVKPFVVVVVAALGNL